MKFQKLISLMMLVIFIGFSGILCGCTTKEELGNLSVVTGLYLDYTENKYRLIADCTNFSEQSNNNSLTTRPIKVSSSTFSKAFTSLKKQSEIPLYFSRAKVLLFSENISAATIKVILEQLFSSQAVPADTVVLRADFPEEKLLQKEQQSFGTAVGNLIKKNDSFLHCKLYQLIKKQENIRKLPTVSFSENGFYLKEGVL